MPMSLIGASIGQVFFQRAAAAKLQGNLSSIVEDTMQRLLLIGFLPMLLITLIGKDIFSVFLGEEWSEAGVYAQILGSWLLLDFISSPISTLNSILGKQEIDLFFNIVIIICRILSLVIGGMFENEYLALSLYSVSGTFLWTLLTIWFIKLSKANLLRIIFDIMLPLSNCFIILFIIIVCKWFLYFNSLILVFLSCLLLLSYYTFDYFCLTKINLICKRIQKG